MSDSSKPTPSERSSEDRQLAEELVERACGEGVDLVGPDRLLSGLTKKVPEAAEMSEHLGYDRHHPAGKNTGTSRNGTKSKKVLTYVRPVDIEVPRDRDGSFDPQLVKKLERENWELRWARDSEVGVAFLRNRAHGISTRDPLVVKDAVKTL